LKRKKGWEIEMGLVSGDRFGEGDGLGGDVLVEGLGRWIWGGDGLGREKGWGRVTGSRWRWEGRVWGDMVLGRLICWEKDMGWGRKMVW